MFFVLNRLIDMIDYFPKLSSQALSIISKTLSEDKLQKPFLRLLPKEHVNKYFKLNLIINEKKTVVAVV